MPLRLLMQRGRQTLLTLAPLHLVQGRVTRTRAPETRADEDGPEARMAPPLKLEPLDISQPEILVGPRKGPGGKGASVGPLDQIEVCRATQGPGLLQGACGLGRVRGPWKT